MGQTDGQWDRQSQSAFCCGYFRHCFVAPSPLSVSPHSLPLSFTILYLFISGQTFTQGICNYRVLMEQINARTLPTCFTYFTFELEKFCCVVWPTSFEDRFPRHQMISKQCELCCSLLLHLLHTKGHTHAHIAGKKSPPKNYHNQLAHVKQVVPKATDQLCVLVCVCACVCNIICTHLMLFYVIFSSLFHFEHSFL